MSNRFIPPRGTEPGPSPGEYEFGAQHNETFRSLSTVMKIVAVVTIVFGALQMLQGLRIGLNLSGVLTLGQGLALFATGAWLASAASGFKDVATTQGGDIGHLMYAIQKLKNVFTLQAVLFGIAAVLFVLSIVLVKKATY